MLFGRRNWGDAPTYFWAAALGIAMLVGLGYGAAARLADSEIIALAGRAVFAGIGFDPGASAAAPGANNAARRAAANDPVRRAK